MEDVNEDIFSAIVLGKINDIKKGIDEIEAEIKERRDIDQKSLFDIQNEILEVKNRILEVEQITGSKSNASPIVEEMQKEILTLDAEKRHEAVDLWRDLTALRREIRLYMKELNDLLRRANIIKNERSRNSA